MQRVLVYLEPHPLRNTYTEFIFACPILIPPLHRAAQSGDIKFRIYANPHLIGLIASRYPAYSEYLIRPRESECSRMRQYEGEWNEKSVALRTDLVRGRGEVTDVYVRIIEEVYQRFRFDAILAWSDNGAVRRFVAEHPAVSVLHAEIGPTRAPFHETVYFDPDGTNGAARVLAADLSLLPAADVLPARTWTALAGQPDPKTIGLVDAQCMLGEHNVGVTLPKRFVYIPLQLADDINTLCHSPFETPLDFLQQVIPRFVDQGLSVVVKGHPAAGSRLFNLVRETQALLYAKSLRDKVVVLDRSSPPHLSLAAIGQAAYVCTINSSVGFEALLCQKQVITVGDAVYDVGFKLRRSVSELDRLPEQLVCESHRNRLTSFLCRHYLHPRLAVEQGPALIEGLRFGHERRNAEYSPLEYWSDWMGSFNFGDEFARLRRWSAPLPPPESRKVEQQNEGSDERASSARDKRPEFDAEWYKTYYQDVEKLGMDPLQHYLWIGKKLGRAPNSAVLNAATAAN